MHTQSSFVILQFEQKPFCRPSIALSENRTRDVRKTIYILFYLTSLYYKTFSSGKLNLQEIN